MNGRSIELVVLPDGSLKIEAMGFAGPDCEKATRFLEEALGQVDARRKKPDFRRQVMRRQNIGG